MVLYVECGRHRGTVESEDHRQGGMGVLDRLIGESDTKIRLGEITCVSEHPFENLNRDETYFLTEGLLDELGIEQELFHGVNGEPAVCGDPIPVVDAETGNIRFTLSNPEREVA